MRMLLMLVVLAACGKDIPRRVFKEALIGPGGVVLGEPSKSEWLEFVQSPSKGRYQYKMSGFSKAPFCEYASQDNNVYAIDIHDWVIPTATDLEIQVLFNHEPIDSLYVRVLCTGEGV